MRQFFFEVISKFLPFSSTFRIKITFPLPEGQKTVPHRMGI